uniref:Uncharacterized protein n=1 Tax=Arundo donax TaxID=35708 RepID=A0A0A9GZ10_ARUDO
MQRPLCSVIIRAPQYLIKQGNKQNKIKRAFNCRMVVKFCQKRVSIKWM